MVYEDDVRPPPSFTHSANLSGMFRKHRRSSASVKAFQIFKVEISMLFFMQNPALDGILTGAKETPDRAVTPEVSVINLRTPTDIAE